MTITDKIRGEFLKFYFARHCGCREAAVLAEKWGAEKSRMCVKRLSGMIYRCGIKSGIECDRADIQRRLEKLLT